MLYFFDGTKLLNLLCTPHDFHHISLFFYSQSLFDSFFKKSYSSKTLAEFYIFVEIKPFAKKLCSKPIRL